MHWCPLRRWFKWLLYSSLPQVSKFQGKTRSHLYCCLTFVSLVITVGSRWRCQSPENVLCLTTKLLKAFFWRSSPWKYEIIDWLLIIEFIWESGARTTMVDMFVRWVRGQKYAASLLVINGGWAPTLLPALDANTEDARGEIANVHRRRAF